MRLWHQDLIGVLPGKQLGSQHSECCALRGKGWGKNHSTVNYVFKHPIEHLIAYHNLIMDEMLRRGSAPDKIWRNPNYRGLQLGYDDSVGEIPTFTTNIYIEHNQYYMTECLLNIIEKLKVKYQKLETLNGPKHYLTVETLDDLSTFVALKMTSH